MTTSPIQLGNTDSNSHGLARVTSESHHRLARNTPPSRGVNYTDMDHIQEWQFGEQKGEKSWQGRVSPSQATR